jgi:hypothetical protein
MAGNSPERAWKADGAIDNLRRMDRRLVNSIVYGVIVSWTAFPIFCALIPMVVSAICGCTVNEAASAPCVVFGVDIGKPLYTLGVMGWLGVVTLPTGGVAFALYTIFVVAQRRIAQRRKR